MASSLLFTFNAIFTNTCQFFNALNWAASRLTCNQPVFSRSSSSDHMCRHIQCYSDYDGVVFFPPSLVKITHNEFGANGASQCMCVCACVCPPGRHNFSIMATHGVALVSGRAQLAPMATRSHWIRLLYLYVCWERANICFRHSRTQSRQECILSGLVTFSGINIAHRRTIGRPCQPRPFR